MDEWNEHTMELERESMDRQGEAMEIRLSSLGLAGAYLGEQEIERLQAEVARLREALEELADLMDDVVAGTYKPDSFTTQPARAALSDTTDDWLERHDAGVRERCVEHLHALEKKYRNKERRFIVQRCIAAIREGE